MNVKDLLKEIIPIVFGVLLALLINNWNEQRKDRKYIDKMLGSISEELKENKDELSLKIIEHKQLIDTIEFYMDEETSIGEFIGKVKGIRGVNIKNIGWQAMINSRVELLEYATIKTLSNIDEQKDNMKLQLTKLMDVIYRNPGSTSYEDVELFRLSINDLLYTELRLLALHEEFEELENK